MAQSSLATEKENGNQPEKLINDEQKLKQIKKRAQEAEVQLAAKGYIYNELLGWVLLKELERLGMKLEDKAIPCALVKDPKQGWVKRINPVFLEYLEDKKEAVRGYAHPKTREAIRLLKNEFDIDERPF